MSKGRSSDLDGANTTNKQSQARLVCQGLLFFLRQRGLKVSLGTVGILLNRLLGLI